MKKIKALAILMAMTLTFSMFATAASAADITFCSSEGQSQSYLTSYKFNDFRANLENAKYAALFTFDKTEISEKVKNMEYNLATQIKDDSDEKSEVTIKVLDGSVKQLYFHDYDVDGPVPTDTSDVFASNMDCMNLQLQTKISVTFNNPEGLKPVAIGYMLTSQKNNAKALIYNNVTINLSDPTANPDPFEWNSKSEQARLLRFFGYKAPVGEYIESIEISNLDGTSHLRIDDLCIIYEEESKIETGVRFSEDKAGYIEVNDIDQVLADTSLCVNVSSEKGTGKAIFFAGYDANDMLVFVKTPEDNDPLYTSKGIDAVTKNRLKTAKVFIWDKDTLAPVDINAILD